MKIRLSSVLAVLLLTSQTILAARQLEWLDRGVVAVKVNNGVFLSWRLLGTESSSLGFNLYRDGVKLNATPITGATNYVDASGQLSSLYTVKPVLNGVEQPSDKPTKVIPNFWKSIPLQVPVGGTTPDAVAYTYKPNDASTGDLDGDGQLDIVLKWDPTNSKDNSQASYTGNVFLDGYSMATGARLFRIDLGVNIRAGAHYTQFVVADFDSDGKAEIICKTAPGTKDGTGAYLNMGPADTTDHTKDYRNTSGYILSGPEFVTVFRGTDGKELATQSYNPGRGTVSTWGDTYGNRVDRFLAAAAWLDGNKPSAVLQRGYYTRMAITAWDWNGSALTQRWYYNAATDGQECYSQGNHNLAIGDVDADGKDEILEGACAIDDNGKYLYRTGLGHGDAMHLGDLDPSHAGLEVWEVHEEKTSAYGYELHDARTGTVLMGAKTGTDNGRGLAADIDANNVGYEFWSSANNPLNADSIAIASATKPSVNFRVYWDADLQDELLDGTKLEKWTSTGINRLVTFYNFPTGNGVASINGTKANPSLSADLFGDWREEVVYPTALGDSLIIFTTTTLTTHRLYTLMHDPIYRASISWQNTAYNQPPHVGFFLGSGTGSAPVPPIALVKAMPPVNILSAIQGESFCVGDALQESTNSGFMESGYVNFTNSVGSSVQWSIQSASAATVTMHIRYANGGATDRPVRLIVNGVETITSLSFLSTGSWTNWGVVSVNVTLQAGVNTLQMESIVPEGGANIDQLGFEIPNIQSGACAPVSNLMRFTRPIQWPWYNYDLNGRRVP